jgi:hypothetical protein
MRDFRRRSQGSMTGAPVDALGQKNRKRKQERRQAEEARKSRGLRGDAVKITKIQWGSYHRAPDTGYDPFGQGCINHVGGISVLKTLLTIKVRYPFQTLLLV